MILQFNMNYYIVSLWYRIINTSKFVIPKGLKIRLYIRLWITPDERLSFLQCGSVTPCTFGWAYIKSLQNHSKPFRRKQGKPYMPIITINPSILCHHWIQNRKQPNNSLIRKFEDIITKKKQKKICSASKP